MTNANPIRRAVIKNYRTDDDIRRALQDVCARQRAVDEVERLQALTILDDLAEEMIGRRAASAPDLEAQIKTQRERWARIT